MVLNVALNQARGHMHFHFATTKRQRVAATDSKVYMPQLCRLFTNWPTGPSSNLLDLFKSCLINWPAAGLFQISSTRGITYQIPFIESDDYVAYNNEKGGVIQNLKVDGIADLDSEVRGIPECVSMRAMVESWLADAVMYELWVGSDGKSANKIYYSDLPWLIGKVLYYKQVRLLGITSKNAERREEEIYCRATLAYGALSYRLGERTFFFESRPTSLDAFFLGHVLFTVHAFTRIIGSKKQALGSR